MTTCKKHPIQVVTANGTVLGYVVRHIRSSLWRATGRPPPMVSINGKECRPSVVGSGREAFLRVRLPEGAPRPKDLQHTEATP